MYKDHRPQVLEDVISHNIALSAVSRSASWPAALQLLKQLQDTEGFFLGLLGGNSKHASSGDMDS